MEAQSNYSYWATPEFSNVTGDVVAVLDQAGSFGVVYGGDSVGAVYVYKNDNDKGELSSASNITNRPFPRRHVPGDTFPGDMSPGKICRWKLAGDSFPDNFPRRQQHAHAVFSQPFECHGGHFSPATCRRGL
ncbi:hypothetical protein Tco_1274168 [Tanacetum coccineum]